MCDSSCTSPRRIATEIAWTRLDAERVGYRFDEHWQMALSVDNVFDRQQLVRRAPQFSPSYRRALLSHTMV